MGETIRINLGSGTRTASNFHNFDNSPSVFLHRVPLVKTLLYRVGLLDESRYRADWSNVRWRNLTRGLPFEDATVDKIYTSHFLEHLPPKAARSLLREAYRVLKPGGWIRIVVPDLLYHAERYVARTRDLLSEHGTISPADDSVHSEFMNTVAGFFLKGGRAGREHCYMYDLPSLVCLLQRIGFRSIARRDFREGEESELAALDSRPQDSLHIEARK